jgi:hypothetical protein
LIQINVLLLAGYETTSSGYPNLFIVVTNNFSIFIQSV